jgi:hypothetical protein
MNKKKTTKSRAEKKRKPIRQLIFRLILLVVVTGGILAYGSYKYGWQPFGQKSPRLSQKDSAGNEIEDKKLLDDKIKSVIDKVKQEAEKDDSFAEDAPEPDVATPAPNPTPAPKAKSDQDQLKDFLDSKMK